MTETRWKEIILTLESLFDCDQNCDDGNIITEEECKLVLSVLKNNTPF